MHEPAARISIVGDGRGDGARIRSALDDSQLDVECSRVDSIEALREHCAARVPHLIVCRLESEPELVSAINRLRDTLDPRPGLVLFTENLEPQDYLLTARHQASNVVDLEVPAQLDFVMRREFGHVLLRQRYEEIWLKLETERVIDDSEFAKPADAEPVPPIATMIDDALAREDLELLFQPILSVGDRQLESHEVFLRIRSGDGYIMPGEFIPVAQRYGLMPSIDRWVVQQAIARFKEEQAARTESGRPLPRFFVNLSLHSLVDPVAIGEIINNIGNAELPPGSFVIEVDKDAILNRLKLSKSLNRKVKKMRLQFSLDHFDVDDNKLNYLKHVQLDFIKLNASLVRDLHRKPYNFDSIREIVRAAHDAGVEVIASQVESPRELAQLFEAGVDHIQGYLLAEPSNRLQEGVALDEIAEEGEAEPT